jgi:hypothetical protein
MSRTLIGSSAEKGARLAATMHLARTVLPGTSQWAAWWQGKCLAGPARARLRRFRILGPPSVAVDQRICFGPIEASDNDLVAAEDSADPVPGLHDTNVRHRRGSRCHLRKPNARRDVPTAWLGRHGQQSRPIERWRLCPTALGSAWLRAPEAKPYARKDLRNLPTRPAPAGACSLQEVAPCVRRSTASVAAPQRKTPV